MASTRRSESDPRLCLDFRGLVMLTEPCFAAKGNFLNFPSVYLKTCCQATNSGRFCYMMDTSITSINSMENDIVLFFYRSVCTKATLFLLLSVFDVHNCGRPPDGTRSVLSFPLLHLDSGLNPRTSRGSHCSFTTKLWKKR